MSEIEKLRLEIMAEHARVSMQREFLNRLLRLLVREVSLPVAPLSDELHLLLERADPPHTARSPAESRMREAGHEELKALIEMVEQVIADSREDGGP